jgi:hypothetical protein
VSGAQESGPMTTGSSGDLDPKQKARQNGLVRGLGYFVQLLLGVALSAGAFAAARHGQPLLAVILAVAVISISIIPAAATRLGHRLPPRVSVDGSGTTWSNSRSRDISNGAVTLGLFASFGSLCVLGLAKRIHIPLLDEYPSMYLAFGVVALVCVAGLVSMARRGTSAYVRLTPQGFAFAYGFAASTGRWSDVVAVTDDVLPMRFGIGRFKIEQPGGPSPCAITMVMRDGPKYGVPDGNYVAASGGALRELVRFYWQHPGERGELTDGRASERLTSLGAMPD